MDACVLFAHGSVNSSDEIPLFVRAIFHGKEPAPEVVEEVRRRYEAIGGSPLNRINGELAAAVERELGIPVRVANRMAAPFMRTVLEELSSCKRIGVVPLAQYSAHVYQEAAERSARELSFDTGRELHIACAPSWGMEPLLIEAFVRAAHEAMLDAKPPFASVFSAHSLPLSVIEGGDPYEREVRASAKAVADCAGLKNWSIAYQSQGMSAARGRPIGWLGPSLVQALDASKARGDAGVVVLPIGFLADHTEVLYDIDVAMNTWASDRGMWLRRARSLNTSPIVVEAIASVARRLRFE